ncbi:hypothetical protein [Acidovorax sp. Root70]|jgi:hypothetical protein|uniref:hypothetical protein n=1 Tax=Comamonadaceae TaxID=80864 RepID=UPI0007006DDF|nr:hypothetical protein [Acidovorax sp. Root70]KRB40264.1 hypothetical protein ASD94_17185 [Acidovorax sp. Root70]
MARSTQASLEASRKKAGLAAAAKLEAAADALNAYMRACRECADASNPDRNGAADSRVILVSQCSHYSSYLQDIYSK